jgi:hypothetical protein
MEIQREEKRTTYQEYVEHAIAWSQTKQPPQHWDVRCVY